MSTSMPGENDGFVTALLTDFYQVSMAYGYWKHGRHEEPSVFDMFFRKNPFHGSFTLFAGLDTVLDYVKNFRFSESDVEFLKQYLPKGAEDGFFEYLRNLDCSQVTIYGVQEGSVVFPRVPILRVEGPLGICQLLETTLLNLTNFASLITTNAARMRIAAGPDKLLLEFGLRRAQGPNGAMTASKCALLGGFDGTSNCQAGKLFDIKISGTHAHSFVCSFQGVEDLKNRMLDGVDFWALVGKKRISQGWSNTNEGELAAFVAYAIAFPEGFLALVDTYDTLESGVPNFLAVSLALLELGYKPKGIRLDSGDLSYLSIETRKMFMEVNNKVSSDFDFSKLTIVASNDINEKVLISLNDQGHEIDAFGIGTNLVTCQAQPALGMVFKLVEIKKRPCIKLSQTVAKMTIPGCKNAYRFYGSDGKAILDFMQPSHHKDPKPGTKYLCRHPTDMSKRAYVTPSKVTPLLKPVWKDGKAIDTPSFAETRQFALEQLTKLRQDMVRLHNPTGYKVSVSEDLYESTQELWLSSAPVKEIS
mmetsp:Transcript_25311/g.30941  ORF Transcript_25311/g.30941 Transcript_25311/m.30941 type:complete len:532 (+) Transcript_25311:459-2054(+)|eukprot:CAMPEP_0204826564 /NCGR_PEP_ID=MMETSP1346-20131115/4233_1 /ASSEMBLY_ACC=CAM_ASM_000771 /TAXON_ID=215587 /ORGANISM="Aplanochytrium stocchinoi, Strain GSBS06" /LENGTH=531 /DNA_ID=CAMNT_0051954651 /DNA_START=387 /DNA_END=1982 /DNA_ORIENTATION=+